MVESYSLQDVRMPKYVWVSVLYISWTKMQKVRSSLTYYISKKKEEKINLDWKIPVSFLLDKYVPQVSAKTTKAFEMVTR